jgi:hypothetical protein
MAEQNTPCGWLKAIHYHHDDYTIEPGEDTWISDPGRRDANGNHTKRADGEWWGEPSWKVNDLLGLYFTGTLKVPVLATVTAAPKFDPALVREGSRGEEPDAGDRWPWVTQVRGVSSITNLEMAPTVEDLGVIPALMRRRFKLKLTDEQRDSLRAAFGLTA